MSLIQYRFKLNHDYVVEACELTEETVGLLFNEIKEVMIVEEIDPFDSSKKFPALNVRTPHGIRRASVGDYVGKDPQGRPFVMPAGPFAQTYDEI